MSKTFLLALLLLSTLSGCQTSCDKDSDKDIEACYEESLIVDLNKSTNLILKLLETKQITFVLQDCSPVDIERLVKNVSPAQIAMESEVLSCPLPVLVFFYTTKDEALMAELEQLIIDLKPEVKLVFVDGNELFRVVEDAHLNSLPALSFIDNREEIAFYEPLVKEHLQEVKKELKELLANKKNKNC